MKNVKLILPLNQKGRSNRYFSNELKQKLVRDLERNVITKAEISRAYQVSRTSIDRWVYKYSILMKKGVKMVVESKSATQTILALKEELKQMKELLGDKEVKISYLEKLIELTEKDLSIDIKKKGKR